MHIFILTGVQKEHISEYKNGHLLLKNILFLCLNSKMRVTCMPVACFPFYLFTANALFFSSLVVAYVCTFLS